jgi:hypothetical protein
LENQLDDAKVIEYYDSSKPKRIQYLIGDTSIVHHLTENGIPTQKLIYIKDWLYEKNLADEEGNTYLFERFDKARKEEMVRYRVEFSNSGDTLAYGYMKNEDTYFGTWIDVSKPNFKIITMLGNEGELPDSISIYYKDSYLRTVARDQIDDPEIFEMR